MRRQIICAIAAVLMLAASAPAQQNSTAATGKAANAVAVHPDLSGNWAYSIALPGGALKKVENGSTTFATLDLSGRMPAKTAVEGALPYTSAPSYKPELQGKVKYLLDHEAKLDKVFFCGKPGVPRISSPRQIIQLPTETIFLYEDASGDPYRIIPTDGRPHRADADPSYYGDAIGHWEERHSWLIRRTSWRIPGSARADIFTPRRCTSPSVSGKSAKTSRIKSPWTIQTC
jgi:hypothetical protein